MDVISKSSHIVNQMKPQSVTVNNTERTNETPTVKENKDVVKNQEQPLKEQESVSKEELETQLNSMNKMMEAKNIGLKYNFHEKLDRIFVQVINKDTDEVVKEIPSEKFLDMISSMLEYMGLLIDERV